MPEELEVIALGPRSRSGLENIRDVLTAGIATTTCRGEKIGTIPNEHGFKEGYRDEPVSSTQLALKRGETRRRSENEQEETPYPMRLGVIEQPFADAFACGGGICFAHLENGKESAIASSELRLIDPRLRLCEGFHLRNLGERCARFILTAHLRENIGKHSILPRLIRLPRHGALLDFEGFIEAILPEPHAGDQIERLGIMHIEPARMARGGGRTLGISLFGI